MPIFMDRHDSKDVTAEDIAEAHKKDLAIQDQYGVRYLTSWFDESRRTTEGNSAGLDVLTPAGPEAGNA